MTKHPMASYPRLEKSLTLSTLPPEWLTDLHPEIQRQVRASHRKVVVLDDDPTGTQTVHNVPVLTEWPVDALSRELNDEAHTAFYLLTNSRSLPEHEARSLNANLGQHLAQAAQQTGQTFSVVSRSDSTLRGHFPSEVEALAQALDIEFDAWLIIPFFLEGGRYTLNNIHYVAEGDILIPAGQTEFARDAAFGYQASDLRHWVAEKTQGRVPAKAVASISLNTLRQDGPDSVTQQLLNLSHSQVCVVNAVSYRDLEVFVLGLLNAEAQGRRYVYRTAASFVQVRAGIPPHPLLTQTTLPLTESEQTGGLIIAGSYVPRTTQQLKTLWERTDIKRVEVSARALSAKSIQQSSEVRRAAWAAETALHNGRDVVLYTSRELLTSNDAVESLAIGQKISAGLVSMVQQINTRPRYILAKGGITSSDIATNGLGVKKANVLGQILPGVPVWQLGSESTYPGLAYIVFPGNVGGPDALVKIVEMLH